MVFGNHEDRHPVSPFRRRPGSPGEIPRPLRAGGHRLSSRSSGRARRSPPLPGRGVLVSLHLLLRDPASFRAGSVQPHRGSTRGEEVPGHFPDARRGLLERHDRSAPGSALERRQPQGTPCRCIRQEQARSRGATCSVLPAAGRSVLGSQAPGRQAVAGPDRGTCERHCGCPAGGLGW